MDVETRGHGRRHTAVAVLGTVIVAVVFATMLLRQRPPEVYYGLFLFHNGPSAVVLLWMGRFILRRQRGHRAGLIFMVIGVIQVVHVVAALVADVRLVDAGIEAPITPDFAMTPADLPLGAAVALWAMGWLWVPAPVLAITMLPLVFPDGRLPGPAWRPVVAIAAAGAAALMVGLGIDGWPTADWAPEDTPAPLQALIAVGGLGVLTATVAGFVAMAMRWRHADPSRRSQFRVVGAAAATLALLGIATYPWQQVWVPVILVAFHGLLVAYALAVARYRLHDLEPVLGRAAVAAILSVLVAAIYVVIVVGVGSLVGRGVDSTWLPLAAVGVVALLIEPARRRARRLVDRLLYGRRADRTEVMSRLAARASTSRMADVLGEVTELLVRSTGAARAEVWLDLSAQLQPAAATGNSSEPEPVLRAAVAHHNEQIGELRLFARAASDLVPDAAQLLGDVAHALGVVVRNDQLTVQLRAQLDELHASRQRLVEAHDQARRSLERDIHDGAQARLISLRLRLGALRAHTGGPDDRRLAEELDTLGHEVDTAVRSLRDLARGLHPPILEQSGLAAALRAYTRDLPVPVSVTAHSARRYRRAVEGAAYFCCLEAVQNAVRHAGTQRIAVELHADENVLRFCVRDDGAGFVPDHRRAGTGLVNIDDRVSALGGTTVVESALGGGTRVTGTIPAQSLAEDR